MNHVNFNDGLLTPQDFIALSEEGVPVQELPDQVLQSPLFLWDGPEEDQLQSMSNLDIHSKIREQPHVLPFQTMRLYIRSGASEKAWGIKGFKIWMHHVDKILYARVMRVGVKGDEKVVLGITTTLQKDRIRAAYRNGDVFVGPHQFSKEGHMREYVSGIFTALCWFIREVSLPSNFISSVSPDKKGKSVEWVKARTHYVLLHKAHPANSKEVSAGSTVSRNTESIKRQAHTRRAHARVLRSPRFRNKLGLTIHVKATWVGPSEWRENGSIYRMIPRNQSFH